MAAQPLSPSSSSSSASPSPNRPRGDASPERLGSRRRRRRLIEAPRAVPLALRLAFLAALGVDGGGLFDGGLVKSADGFRFGEEAKSFNRTPRRMGATDLAADEAKAIHFEAVAEGDESFIRAPRRMEAADLAADEAKAIHFEAVAEGDEDARAEAAPGALASPQEYFFVRTPVWRFLDGIVQIKCSPLAREQWRAHQDCIAKVDEAGGVILSTMIGKEVTFRHFIGRKDCDIAVQSWRKDYAEQYPSLPECTLDLPRDTSQEEAASVALDIAGVTRSKVFQDLDDLVRANCSDKGRAQWLLYRDCVLSIGEPVLVAAHRPAEPSILLGELKGAQECDATVARLRWELAQKYSAFAACTQNLPHQAALMPASARPPIPAGASA